MKILFWLEPHFELVQPGVMKTWLVWFERIAMELAKTERDFDFRIVCLDSPSAKEHIHSQEARLILLSQAELLVQWQLAGNAFMELEHDRVPNDLCSQLLAVLYARLGDFDPEVVFLLNQQPWLRRGFSNALFVNSEMSWSSRAPFPCSWHLDISGAGKGRVLADYSEEFLEAQTLSETFDIVDRIRLIANDRLTSSSAGSFVQLLRKTYTTVKMLPIGIFDCLDGKTSFFSMLDKFLSEQDGSSALILVRHPMWQILRSEQVSYLSSKYAYVYDGDEIGSQYLLPYIDTVIGDFSTVSTQALLFDKKVESVRRDFNHFPVDTPLRNPLVDLVAKADVERRNRILYWLVTHYSIGEQFLFNGFWLGSFLRRAIEAVREGQPWAAYEMPIATFDDWDDSKWRCIPVKGAGYSEARLYISEQLDGVPQGFSESRSIGMEYPISGQRQTLKLLLPSDALPIAAVRLDPASVPVAFLLHGLSFVGSDSVELWCWEGNENTFQNCGGLAMRKSEAGLLILSLGNDPYFDISVPSECLAKVSANSGLFLDFTPISLLDVVPEVLAQDDLLFAELRSKNDSLTALPSIALGSTSGLAKLTSDLDSLAILFKDSLNKRDKRIKEQTVQLNTMRDELIRAQAQLDLLKDLMFEGRPMDRL